MAPVTVLILHPAAPPDAGPLVRANAAVRATNARRLADRFTAAGAAEVRIVAGPPDGRSFGERLASLVPSLPRDHGLVLAGSGALPLARTRDLAWFLEVGASGLAVARANNRFSADVVALGRPAILVSVPPDLSDNALPRWLAANGVEVHDRRTVRRLQVDLDTPADALWTGGALGRAARTALAETAGADGARAAATLDAVRARLRAVADDPGAEIVIAGRTSARTLAILEHGLRARVRAIVEERGLRTAPPAQRQPASVLGSLIARDGPDAFGQLLATLGDGALVDTRVLLADRCGRDEGAWPPAEDRYASDLLLPELVADPWLQALTRAAAEAPLPIALGGHTLVGPAAPLVLAARRRFRSA